MEIVRLSDEVRTVLTAIRREMLRHIRDNRHKGPHGGALATRVRVSTEAWATLANERQRMTKIDGARLEKDESLEPHEVVAEAV